MFALHGNLPSQSFKRCKHIIIGSIWSFATVYLFIHMFVNVYWRWYTPDVDRLMNFEFASQWTQVILFTIVSGMYILSAGHLRVLQKHMVSKDRPLMKKTLFVWMLFTLYVLTALILVYSTYTQGVYNWQDLFSSILVDIVFILMRIMLTIILAKFQLDFRLLT